MLTNSSLTVYHKSFDDETRMEKWVRFNYDKVWFFGGKGARLNKGYDGANDVDIRIFYALNKDLDINNFAIEDILVQGTLTQEIKAQNDLKNFLTYTITSINNNNFGINKHIHIGGK